MNNLYLNSTSSTPEVKFDCKTGILELKGTSTPEESGRFYQPVLNWLEEYSLNPAPLTVLEFKMDYFNTSSTVFMLRLMKIIVKMGKEGKKAAIRWYHEEDDEDFIEAGKDFGVLAKTDIELVKN